MPRPVSHPRLEAAAAASPFASPTAFALRLTALTRDAVGVLDGGPTATLAAALEDFLRTRAAGMSLDVLRQLRDAAWFPPGRLRVPLHDHLRALAGRYLVHAGRRVALRPDGDPAERAAAWRWVSLALPADLLVGALCSTSSLEPPDDAALLVTPRLAELLRKPCAETHLHVGAGIPFGLLWAALMRDLSTSRLRLRAATGAPPFGDADAFTGHLLAGATVRLLLASFLRRREHAGAAETFDAFLRARLRHIADAVPWGFGAHEAHRGLLHALRLVERRAAPPPLELARRLYQALSGPPHARGQPSSTGEVIANDPLSTWLPWSPGLALPETRLICRALRYLADDGGGDGAFALAFWQYQRIRCMTHGFLVEEPGTAGLDWFTRHYGRISPLRGTLTVLTYSSALELQSRDLSLAALEARTSPEPAWTKVRDEVRELARQARRFRPPPRRPRPEVGLVLHLIKEHERTLPTGQKRLHADPGHPAFGCRFGAWFHERQRQAVAIETALQRHPELLLVLRGIDVANVELAVPTWPLVPLFRRVREASRRASARLGRVRPRWEAGPMRATVHAGEDFRRLVEGLRRIHEPIEFGMLEMGDRLGHAVALGEDPERWAAAARTVAQPAEERLDDLLWELERYRRREIGAETGRLEHVRGEAVALAREIYDGDERFDLDDLLAARALRHSAAALARVGYPFFRERPVRRAPERLFQRYLSDAEVFARGQRPVHVEADATEAAMLRAAQRWLRGALGAREITVECNPSSNLLIADYLALDEHAAFRLQPVAGMTAPEGPPVLVSVNTDNPVTFASSLADEFAHIYFALLGRDVPADAALAWLDKARENGHLSRFTLRASAEPRALLDLSPRRR
ncbi:hypothetical protein WME98_17975 [Sorangium sp. So ce296]|uniref:hypothetical protein n=1 Tax=Sorangium sp. So ce296 TaxID=3133296 RepID=UPI003F6064EB